MGRQRERGSGGARRPLQLTDQALVAVALARLYAPERPATAADLLVGLATEAEGRAGRRLRIQSNAVATLHERAQLLARRAPSLDVTLAWADDDTCLRPVATLDLLRAACDVGGSDLADLLDGCGLSRERLRAPPSAGSASEALAETRGLDPHGSPGLDAPVARAVARARAVGGGAMTLLVALALEAETAPEQVGLDVERVTARAATMTGSALGADPLWDAGIDAVLDAARLASIEPGRLAPIDVVRACALAGGRGPAGLLAADPPESP